MDNCKVLFIRLKLYLMSIGINNYSINVTKNGLMFSVDGKPLVGIFEKNLICRISEPFYDEILAMEGVTNPRPSRTNSKIVFVASNVILTKKQLAFWIDHCLLAHPDAPRTRKRQKKQPNEEITTTQDD